MEEMEEAKDLEVAEEVRETGRSRMIIFLVFPTYYLFLEHME